MPSATAQRPARPRRLPQRTCVGCGTVSAKRDLVRIVRGAGGEVRPDPTGKKSGRGAYLHANPACWSNALKKKRLERSLKVTLSIPDLEALNSYAATLPLEVSG